MTVKAGAEPKAQTIIYVHGIGNKPKESVLKCQWDTALFGTGLGDRSRMAYWVNRDYYPKPEDTTCGEPDHTAVEDDEATTATIMALAVERSVDEAKADRARNQGACGFARGGSLPGLRSQKSCAVNPQLTGMPSPQPT